MQSFLFFIFILFYFLSFVLATKTNEQKRLTIKYPPGQRKTRRWSNGVREAGRTDADVEQVGLQLHQQVILRHAPVHPELAHGHAAVLPHSLHHLKQPTTITITIATTPLPPAATHHHRHHHYLLHHLQLPITTTTTIIIIIITATTSITICSNPPPPPSSPPPSPPSPPAATHHHHHRHKARVC